MSSASDSVPNNTNTTTLNLKLDIPDPVATPVESNTHLHHNHHASSPKAKDDSPENEVHESLLQDDQSPDFEQNHEIAAAFQQVQTQQSRTDISDDAIGEEPAASPQISEMGNGRSFDWKLPKKGHIERFKGSLGGVRRSSSKTLSKFNQEFIPEHSYDSSTMGNSYLQHLQELYQGTAMENNVKSSGRSSGRGLEKVTKRHPNRQGSIFKRRIRHSYYDIAKRKLQRRNSKTVEDPEEFEDLVQQIKSSIRVPKDERVRDLQISKKTELEYLKNYNDDYPLLGLRKSLMKVKSVISLACLKTIQHPIFDYFILLVIIANSIILAFNDPTTDESNLPPQVDYVFLAIYTCEMTLKILGMGFISAPNSYLRDYWNIVDFIIVVTAYIPYVVSSNSLDLRAFRSLRVLRPLRTISNIEALRMIIATLFNVLKPLADTLLILFFLFMIFAIGGLQLFQGVLKKRCFSLDTGIPVTDLDEDTDNYQKYCTTDEDCTGSGTEQYICGKMIDNPDYGVTNFDNIFSSLLMVFQTVTLEGWSDIMNILHKTFSPWAALYFIFLIFVGAFFLLNLTLAVIKAEFTLHSHSHSSEKGNLKTRKDIFNIWGNSKIAEKVAEHKLDILSIRKKQAISTIGYNKYQFKRDQLIAVPASKFTKNKQARQLKQKSTLSEKFKNSAGGKLARSFTKLLKDYQASLKKKKISKVHTEKKPQIRAKEISSLDDSPNSTSLIIRKHDSDSPFGNRSDNSKSPAPTTYGDTSFQALYNQDQSRSVLQTIGNDTSLNGGSRSIINLKTVSDIQDRSTPEIPLKKSDSIHRNSRSRLKLDFGKVGELNKIVEVASPHQEEPETRRDRKGKEYLDKNKKAFLMPIMSQAQYKKTEKEELDKSSFISQTPDQTVRTKNPSSSVTRPQMKSADGPEELDSNTNSLRAITPINSKRDRSHIKEIQNKYAGLAKRMSTDRSRSAIIQRLNQVKAFKKVTESKGLNTSLEMSTKIGQGALDRSLAITEDLEAEVRKSTVKMALEEEFKERAKEKTLEEIAKDRRKTRTFKQIALRPRNSQINILDKIKGPEKVQKSAFSNYFQSPGAEGGDNIDIEDDMTVVEHFKKEETENKKEKKLVIDFRRVKAVPIYTREYESNSVDDVLPLAKEQARQRIELYEQKMLREKYLPLEFELTRLDKQRAEHREKLRYQLEEEETELWEDIVKDTANKTVKFAKVPATDKAFKVNSEVDTKIVDQKKLPKKSTNVKVYGKLAIQRSEKARRLARRLKREEMIQEAEQEIKDEFLLCEGTSGKGGGGSRTSGQPSLNKLTFSQKADVPFRINLFDRNININDYKEVRMRINREIYPESTKEESEAKEQENLKALAFENEYKEIRKKDLEAQRITSKNWSGDNVLLLSAIEFPIDRVKTFLSNQDYDIWRTGFMGLIHAMRRKAKFFMNSSTFNAVIIISVLINTIILASNGLIADSDTSSTLNSLNLTFTIIFTIEMGIKIFALGITKYVKDLTNLLDAFIVVLSLVEAVFLSDNGKSAVSAFRTFRLFRTFRVIRMTKLLRSLSYMQIIIGVIVRSLKKFAYIAVLLFLLIFVFSLLGMQIFGGNFSFSDNVGPDRLRESFDTFVGAVMSVIQCMTQENWQDILFLAMRSSVNKIISLAYLISWIFIGNYIFLNLFLAILLDEFMSDEVEEDLKDMPIQSAEENDEDEYRLKNETSAPSVTSRDLPTPKSMKRTRSRNNTARSWAPEDEDEEGERKTYMFEGVRCERAFWLFSKSNIIRRFCWRVVKHRYFESAILTVIILSSVKLALDTYISDDNVELQSVTNTFDDIFNIFFALEALVKVISFGFILDRNSYLRETWNVLDFLIVVASILDMSMDGLNMSFIKILRLLRTFRPLRFISHNVSMRLIVTALLESVSAIFNVLIVVMIVWLMFAILAVNLVGDKLGFCDGLPSTMNYYGIGIEQCASLGGQWTTPNVNFDNVFNAMLSLFIVSTQENWPVIMNTTVDANDASAGPIEGGNAAFGYLFFAVFLFIGSYFLMNLFVGVIFLNFTRAQKSENRLQKFFTLKQQKWIIMQKLILSAKPDLSRVEPHKPWMKKFFRIINHLYFDIFIIAAILLNILTMAMDYDDASDNYENALQYINWFFSFIFVVEMILKHLGLGFRRYWMSPWNQFDAFVVIASLIDILFSIFQQSFLSVLRVGPQLARVLRVLRVSRLLKLVKKFQGLQKIINTLIFSLPSLLNTGALLFLVFFIYSILAVFLFKDITQGDTINDIVNFSNFSNAIITLFRCSTGENWYVIMFDTVYPAQCSDGTDNCGTIAGFAFWLSFIVVCQYIFLNLFILVILQQFEDYHLNPDNPVNQFRTDLDTFKTHWETYALKHGGRKIPAKQLLTFFHTLEAPLGFKNLKIKKTEIAKEITLMNLLADWKGMMFYNDVLFGAMKNAHGSEEALEEIPISIVKEELRTRQKLESLKRKYHFRGSITVGVPRKPRQVQKKAENPIFTMLMIGMTLKAWSNFSHRIVEKRKAAEENEIAYASSENEEEVDDNEDSESSVSSRSSESNSEDRSLDGEIEEQSLIESQRRENIRKPSEKMTSNRSYGTRKRVSVADPEVKEEDHQRDIAPNKSYTIVLTKPDEEDQDERISIQEVNEEQNQVQIVPQMSLEAGKVVENNDNEQNISQMKSSNRTKRSRSMSQGEIDQGKVVINYNINNNYTINNHYYLSQNPLEGEREQLVPFAREVSVEVQRDISPNLSLTASPAKLK